MAEAIPDAGSAGVASVQVVARFRPLNDLEKEAGSTDAFLLDSETQSISTRPEAVEQHHFRFDKVLPPHCKQEQVYSEVEPIVRSVLDGFNATIFAYGQTSSGKTFTMEGVVDDEHLRGVIPRMVSTIFSGIESAATTVEFALRVSMIEVYQERIRDLLTADSGNGTDAISPGTSAQNNGSIAGATEVDPCNLRVFEDAARGIYVAGATEVMIGAPSEVLDVLRRGQRSRAAGATGMNANSSRSHSVFMLFLEQRDLLALSTKVGKLYLVDLAGSEKVQKTKAHGQRLEEAKHINKSLSTLGMVITALTDGKSTHIPYRDSKLTRVLQESLGGNARTALIICCSPAAYNQAETLSTLRFGSRAKLMVNKATVNERRSVSELTQLLQQVREENDQLKAVMRTAGLPLDNIGAGSSSSSAATAAPASSGSSETASAAELQEQLFVLEAANRRLGQTCNELEAKSATMDELRAELEQQLSLNEGLEAEARSLSDEVEVVNDQCRIEMETRAEAQHKAAEKAAELDVMGLRLQALEAEREEERRAAAARLEKVEALLATRTDRARREKEEAVAEANRVAARKLQEALESAKSTEGTGIAEAVREACAETEARCRMHEMEALREVKQQASETMEAVLAAQRDAEIERGKEAVQREEDARVVLEQALVRERAAAQDERVAALQALREDEEARCEAAVAALQRRGGLPSV